MANLLSRYGKIIGGGSPREEMIAPVELSTTASQAYEIGEQFILNGVLYTATAAITAGGTIVIDGNCTASDTVTEQLKSLLHIETTAITGNSINNGNTDISVTEPTVSGYKVLSLINAFVNTSSPIWVKGFYFDSGTTWRLKVQSQEGGTVARTIVYTWLMIKE